jgi:hypothetical protein
VRLLTSDIVALVRHRPEIPTVVDGMIAFGESLEPYDAGDGVVHLYDADGRLVVSIETPQLVEVRGEIERLLGPEPAGRVRVPVWWVEVRAAAGVPDAVRIARKFADDLVHWQGGTIWPEAASPAATVSPRGSASSTGAASPRGATSSTGSASPRGSASPTGSASSTGAVSPAGGAAAPGARPTEANP